MADVELVIKIDEKAYNALTHAEFDANLVVNEMRKAIANGTLLPKGHGRIIDESKIILPFLESETDEKWVEIGINNAPTIIKADSEEGSMRKQRIIEAEQNAKDLAEIICEHIAEEADYGNVDREWYYEKVVQYMRAESEE